MIFSQFRRQVFEPLHVAITNSPKLRYWRELEKTQYLSQKQLEEIQWQRLKNLWVFLWDNNSFYKNRFLKAGLTPKSLKSPEDISLFPILTKKDVRLNTDSMISDGFIKDKLHHFKTGGSTGKALDIYITEECSEMRNACARRHDRWTTWETCEPIGAVWGNPKLPSTIKEKILDALVQPYIYLDTMSVTRKSVQQFAQAWRKVKPTLLFGHAHSLYILAEYIQTLAIDVIQPKGIISTSMMLLPNERALIENVFGCKVTDRYGCEEVSLIGCECKVHNGMHMNIEHLVIEFLGDDGTSVKAGETGNIVVTDLMNKAMPFIRYKVEDVGIPLERQCSCGCNLPLMGKVAGRVADFLIKKDGTRVAGISLIENTLTKMPGIDQMQIVQDDRLTLKLNLVPGLMYTSETELELLSYFKTVFDGIDIILNKTDGIQPEKSGKYRFSICNIKESIGN